MSQPRGARRHRGWRLRRRGLRDGTWLPSEAAPLITRIAADVVADGIFRARSLKVCLTLSCSMSLLRGLGSRVRSHDNNRGPAQMALGLGTSPGPGGTPLAERGADAVSSTFLLQLASSSPILARTAHYRKFERTGIYGDPARGRGSRFTQGKCHCASRRGTFARVGMGSIGTCPRSPGGIWSVMRPNHDRLSLHVCRLSAPAADVRSGPPDFSFLDSGISRALRRDTAAHPTHAHTRRAHHTPRPADAMGGLRRRARAFHSSPHAPSGPARGLMLPSNALARANTAHGRLESGPHPARRKGNAPPYARAPLYSVAKPAGWAGPSCK